MTTCQGPPKLAAVLDERMRGPITDEAIDGTRMQLD
jgi:hypothetical protein